MGITELTVAVCGRGCCRCWCSWGWSAGLSLWFPRMLGVMSPAAAVMGRVPAGAPGGQVNLSLRRSFVIVKIRVFPRSRCRSAGPDCEARVVPSRLPPRLPRCARQRLLPLRPA